MGDANAKAFGRYLFGPGHRERPLVRAVRGLLRRDDVRFSLRFVAFALAAWLLYVGFASDLSPFGAATVAAVVAGANALGMDAAAQGAFVDFGGGAYRYELSLGCTGLFVGALFAAAVLAYPTAGRQRAIGLAVGIPLLLAFNWARLLSMGWLGLHQPSLVESAHVFWWQAFFVLATGIGWLAWLRLVVERPRGAERGRNVREIARAAATFTALLAASALVAAWSPVDEAVRALVHQAAAAVASALSLPPRSAPVLPGLLGYGLVASTAALFLATPRGSWILKLRGALAWGVAPSLAVQVALSVVLDAIGQASNTTEGAWIVLLFAGQMIVPAAAWYAWIRRHGLAPPARFARRYVCPECGRDRADIVDHVRTAHARQAHALVRTLARRHPELAAAEGRER